MFEGEFSKGPEGDCSEGGGEFSKGGGGEFSLRSCDLLMWILSFSSEVNFQKLFFFTAPFSVNCATEKNHTKTHARIHLVFFRYQNTVFHRGGLALQGGEFLG